MVPGGRKWPRLSGGVGVGGIVGSRLERDTECTPPGGAQLGHLGGGGGAMGAGVWEAGPHQPDGQAAAFPPSNQR